MAVPDSSDVGAKPAGPTRLVVVAEVRLYSEGLAASLGSRPSLQVLGTAGNRDAALALSATVHPDVVVIDMATRDSLEIVRALKREHADVKIVAFAVDESERDITACAEAGVAGYLPSDGSMDDLVAAIASCTRGELICSPRIAATLFRSVGRLAGMGHQPPDTSPLTARERQIVGLIAARLSNKEIAQRLNIEVATVKNHVHNILEKLQVPTRAEAAAWLLGEGVRRGHRPISPSPAA